MTGIDKESAVVAEARRAGIEAYELDIRRLRELPEVFDAVLCMWSSFGWFDEATNADVLAQMAEKTRPAGVVVLDVFDPAFFHTRQGAHVIERDGRRVHEHKSIERDRLQTTLDYEDGSRDVFEWRLYTADELRALGAARSLECEVVCADFDLGAKPVGDTSRMQLVFRRR